jgi:hypothetical protein
VLYFLHSFFLANSFLSVSLHTFSLPLFLIFIIYLLYYSSSPSSACPLSSSPSSYPCLCSCISTQTSLYTETVLLLRSALSHAFIGQP